MKFNRHDYTYETLGDLIPEDEPVFLLRGQDVFAPALIDLWADRVELRRVEDGSPVERGVEEVTRRQAGRMRNWQRDHKGKIPDIPTREEPHE